MPLKIYGFVGSPPFGAVLMCAKSLGIEVEIVHVDLLNGEHFKEEFSKLSPQHTLPVLDNDGFILVDSHAIMGYLVGKYAEESHLYPKNDIKRRATIDHRLHLDSSIVAARGFLVSRPLVLNGIKPAKETIDLFREGFVILDKQLEIQNTPYIVGSELSIADFSITTTVASWGYFLPSYEADFPNIKAYIDKMKKEPFFEANAKGFEAFKGLMDMKLQ